MNAPSNTRFGSEFASFLFAPIGQDTNGMPLSVMSALARQDVDPWEEAAKLTELPEEEAVTQLAALLGALPRATLESTDRVTVATRLLALLPRHRNHVQSAVESVAQVDLIEHAAVVAPLILAVIIVIFVLVGSWVMGNAQAPGQVEGRSTPPSSPIAQQSSPTNE